MKMPVLRWAAVLVATTCFATAQAPTPPLAFATVSVRPAAPGAHTSGPIFFVDAHSPPKGLLTLTAPVTAYIDFAYSLNEIAAMNATAEKLPHWAIWDMYTVVARPDGEPTWDQLREMMRTMLAERFALKSHEETRTSEVNELVLIKPGVLGPTIKPHPAGETCVRSGQATPAEMSTAPPCDISSMQPGKMYHIGSLDSTMVDFSRHLGSIGSLMGGLPSRTTVDRTGLSGTYDLTLDFHVQFVDDGPAASGDEGGPTFSGALEKQLGMKIVKGTAPVRIFVIDHIAVPTPD